MDRFGREAIRQWKVCSPRAFDALRDPIAHFGHIDAHYQAAAERLAVEDVAVGGDPRELRFGVEQRSQWLLETMPLPPREDTFLDDLDEELIDPRGRFLRAGMPHRSHRLWELLEDPAVPARTFQQQLHTWYDTLPRAPWIEHAGTPTPLFEPEGPSELVRAGTLQQPEIRSWPEATVLTFRAGGLDDSFQVLADATTQGRAWAGGGYIDRSERALVLPPWRDDGSSPDPDELARMVEDCGPLQRGVEYVVTERRPRVVDFHAVRWMVTTGAGKRRRRPLLLFDIDGVLLRHDAPDTKIRASLLRELDPLARSYDLAWATSWESSANTLLEASGHSSWPVIPVASRARSDPDGYDNPRVVPVLEFVGDRPFAWVDDQLTRHDATRLVAGHDCLVLRPNPRQGVTAEDLAALHAWA